MFFELINHATFDASFLYLYVGFMLLSLGLIYLGNVYGKQFARGNCDWSDTGQKVKLNRNETDRPLDINKSLENWLVLTYKRMDEKDDKADNISAYFKGKFKIRGEENWKKSTYSQQLKGFAY